MIDFDILKRYGTTKERFRELFTAEPGSDDYEMRGKWEKMIESHLFEGIQRNLETYEIYASADLAWDGNIITGEMVPLVMYAQKRIGFKSLISRLRDSGCSDEELKKICEYDEEKKEFKDVKINKFIETSVNLVRSFVTRRHAAQASAVLSRRPFFQYEPFSKSYIAQLRGDVLSQRVEMMSDQYDYRHQASQMIRDFLLYPHVVEFPSESWHVERQIRKTNTDITTDGNFGMESYIVREGVPFVRPHPSRVAYDISSPLSSINTDTGCEWIAYWEAVRYGDVRSNTEYFNRETIEFTRRMSELFRAYRAYFEIYYPCTMKFPEGTQDVPGLNDRENNIGVYNTEWDDSAVVLTEYRKKVIPKDWGLGDYPHPVWVRLVVAGEKTVIYGEVLPSSIPACYYGYNESDNRLSNISFAHEAMPWQDQASNLLSQLLLSQKQSLLKVLTLNLDKLSPEMVREIRAILQGDNYYAKPLVLEYSLEDDKEIGRDQEIMRLHEAKQIDDVTLFFKSLVQIIALAERVLNFSPQEQGQPAPREISATEVLEIANTVNTMYNFISKGIDEGLSAKKRIIYEALVSLCEGKIYVPAARRYPESIVTAAGFEVVDEDAEALAETNLREPRQQTIIGTRDALVYNYTFTSREGMDRAPQQQTAQILVNLLAQILQIPGVAERIGNEGIMRIVNAIIRNSGANIDLTLDPIDEVAMAGAETPQGEDSDQLQGTIGEMARILAETEVRGAENEQRLAELTQIVQGLLGASGRMVEGSVAPGTPGQPILDRQPAVVSQPRPTRPMAPEPFGRV